MNLLKHLLTLLAVIWLTACASLTKQSTPQQYNLSIADPNRVQFEGKGAGAGIALMSSMGPMGVALGVAIDVGIGKDIENPMKEAGFDVHMAMETGLQQAYEEPVQWQWVEASAETQLRLKKYGFKILPGGDDLTAAYVELEWVEGEKVTTVVYPNDFIADGYTASGQPLTLLKERGEIGKELMEQAISLVIKRMVQKLSK